MLEQGVTAMVTITVRSSLPKAARRWCVKTWVRDAAISRERSSLPDVQAAACQREKSGKLDGDHGGRTRGLQGKYWMRRTGYNPTSPEGGEHAHTRWKRKRILNCQLISVVLAYNLCNCPRLGVLKRTCSPLSLQNIAIEK